jgi:tryptophan synthase alpha chain
VVQAAYCRALTNGAALADGFSCIADIAASVQVPIVLMVTYNIVLRRGVERFCADAARAGVSGLLVPDLLVEDAEAVRAAAECHGLATVFLAGPDTSETRLVRIAHAATGFVYLIRRRGITGTGGAADNLEQRIAVLRGCSDVPVAVGFGITTPDDVREVGQIADGVIVGSVLLSVAPDVNAVSALTRSFARARTPSAAAPTSAVPA